MNIQHKHLKIFAKTLGFICLSLVMFVIFVAISNVGLAKALFFAFLLIASCCIAITIGAKNNAYGCGVILAIIILIMACIMIWNTAFNPKI